MIFHSHRWPKSFMAIATAALLLGIVWLLRNTDSFPASSELTFTATIAPLADIARNIAGSETDVIQLIPNGASPHSYNLTPQAVADLQDTKTLFIIGHSLDDWSARPAATAASVPVTIVDTNIELHEFGEEEEEHKEKDGHKHEAGSVDPHYWLTVPNAKIIAANIARTMAQYDPDRAEVYQNNLATYLEELDKLEGELQAQAAAAPQKHFIARHDAWSYFAEHYGFELVATYEPVEGHEPSVADLQNLGALSRQYGITTFYAEPQKRSDAAIRFLEEELGLEIKILDAEGGASYIELMRFNMRQLTQ